MDIIEHSVLYRNNCCKTKHTIFNIYDLKKILTFVNNYYLLLFFNYANFA